MSNTVVDIIRQAAESPAYYENMKSAFVEGEMHRSLAFFEDVNEKIRKFRDFNDEHHLPLAWNIPEAHVEERFGRRIIQSIETDGDATLSSPGTQNGNSTGFGVPETLDVTMNDDEDEDGNGVTGLEELENVGIIRVSWKISTDTSQPQDEAEEVESVDDEQDAVAGGASHAQLGISKKQNSKLRGYGGHSVRQAREDSGFYDGRSSVSYSPERAWEAYGRRPSVRLRY
ncbi:hypothetical protein Y699_05138 [Aspergillus fumigatus Z5]|nr:hypothetical protein Y699_05138 [Aspergillus fumigatus Z5]